MTMGLTNVVVTLDRQKVYRDAFTSGLAHLYIPKDDRSNTVTIEKASWFECWIPSDQCREEVAYSLSKGLATIGDALVKYPTDTKYSHLLRNAAYGSLAEMGKWMRTLARHPEGDILEFQLYE